MLTAHTDACCFSWKFNGSIFLFPFVLNVDNAPAAIVGLVGRKEYEQCAKDLYFFIQVSVILRSMKFYLRLSNKLNFCSLSKVNGLFSSFFNT